MSKIHFYLRFHTTPGQSFFVTGNIPQLGSDDTSKALPLKYLNDEYWQASIEVSDVGADIRYSYILRSADGFESIECNNDKVISPSQLKTPHIKLVDIWNYAGEYENAFFTQPFTQTLLKHNGKNTIPHIDSVTHVFKIKAPLLPEHQTMCIIGGCDELGDWETEQAVPMHKEGNWYEVSLDLSKVHFPIAYKYGIWDRHEEAFIRFEEGGNRTLQASDSKELSILHDGFAGLPNNTFKGAGVAIPVFSLRSQDSFGVGEFNDLKLLVDWAKTIGLKLIQLLPLNDTTATHTWADSYPYSAISAFALHPQFVNLQKMAGKKHAAAIKGLKDKQKQLNALPDVDYDEVMKTKMGALHELYKLMKKEWLADSAYKEFYNRNEAWLLPYAAFCYLRDTNNTSDSSKWPTHSVFNKAEVEKLISPKAKTFDDLAIHLFIQYHLHLQLKDAVDYAHKNGLIMKGDIPIGIYRNSCDAWVQPELYNMDAQAGAPPDDFAIKGQNWGFPTYNWKKMQEDGFAWWKQRFEQMSEYFDAFRIDHILGFFRIWSIPMNAVEGVMGHFVPCIPVYTTEFFEKGIWFDYNRYCKPFINHQILEELFGEKTEYIKETFLDFIVPDQYNFKKEFNTQRKIEGWFESNADVEEWIKSRLFELVSNVIMFEEPGSGGQQFHFRIGMENTISFRYLDEHTKVQLKEVYVNYFFRRQDSFWRKEAMHKLPALKASTNMLICGEDLGMVPDCVPGVMKDLGILSLEIQRMPKDPAKKFFHPADAPYMSVVTPSTHDMSTIRGWWQENRENTQQFYNHELGQWGTAPFYCEPWINRAIVTQHIYSPAMWSIFQLQDLLGIDGELRRNNPEEERINIPADPKHYWRYRMHLSLEDLLKAKEFNSDINNLLVDSGRA